MSEASLKKRTLAGLAEKLNDLPVLPAVVMRLMGAAPSSETYFDEVLSLAESDPPFAARVIQAANSADSAPATPIDSLRMAVTSLGGRRIGDLVTAMAVTRVFVPHTDAQRSLWVHSLETAALAREIAKQRRNDDLSPDGAYLAGLLHDLGRFVMFDGAPEELDSVDESGWSTTDDLVETEREVCGFDHAELGWHACLHWGIPETIASLVRDHHELDPDACSAAASPQRQAVAVVQVADMISMTRRNRSDMFELAEDDLVRLIAEGVCARWDPAPVPAANLAPHLNEIMTEAEKLAANLGLCPGS